ncbi:MAG: hypothetical protein KIG16_05180 [Eubacteriales bacterium]|nr:hypothetical protein [Eubacteriales bacterium]
MFEEKLHELLENEQQTYALLDLLNNEIFEKELIKFTEDAFRQTVNLSFVPEESKKKVMLGLTFIALKYYDGALWPHVCNKYNSIACDDKLLISQIRDNVLNFYTKKYNCDRKQYQIPVINSIVPFHYAPSYIEFVNDIYVKNLDCDLVSYDLNEEINNVF